MNNAVAFYTKSWENSSINPDNIIKADLSQINEAAKSYGREYEKQFIAYYFYFIIYSILYINLLYYIISLNSFFRSFDSIQTYKNQPTQSRRNKTLSFNIDQFQTDSFNTYDSLRSYNFPFNSKLNFNITMCYFTEKIIFSLN